MRQQPGRMVPAPPTNLARLLPARVPKLAPAILRPARAPSAALRLLSQVAEAVSLSMPLCARFEHSRARDNSQKRPGLKLGYPWLSLRSAQRYPYLSRLILNCTIIGYPGISHHKNLILAYPKSTFLSRLMPGYPWINNTLHFPRISRYTWGCGRM